VGGRILQFSGFAVDRSGLIVTTAHDLDGIDEVTVWSDSIERIRGKVARRDPKRDLTLIRVERGFSAVVPPGKGRRRLNMGEKLFSMVCPVNSHARLRIGVIDEPPAIVKGQPLWQVNMEVSHGDSGGAVLDSKGRLAGVVKGRYRGVWSRGFLIPTDTLREFLGSGER
jgi:serine protease Do